MRCSHCGGQTSDPVVVYDWDSNTTAVFDFRIVGRGSCVAKSRAACTVDPAPFFAQRASGEYGVHIGRSDRVAGLLAGSSADRFGFTFDQSQMIRWARFADESQAE